MRVLLDTHVLLLSLSEPERMAAEAAQVFRERGTRAIVSVASLWEISIKRAAGRLIVPDDLPEIIHDMGHEWLHVRPMHAWRAGALPPHHRDPFDRLLVAQAQIEGLVLLTRDRAIQAYDVEILRA